MIVVSTHSDDLREIPELSIRCVMTSNGLRCTARTRYRHRMRLCTNDAAKGDKPGSTNTSGCERICMQPNPLSPASTNHHFVRSSCKPKGFSSVLLGFLLLVAILTPLTSADEEKSATEAVSQDVIVVIVRDIPVAAQKLLHHRDIAHAAA